MIFLVAAMDKQGGIGYKGQLPWFFEKSKPHPYPQDWEWVRKFIRNKNIVVGERTWVEDLERVALAESFNFVLTHNADSLGGTNNSNVMFVTQIENLISFGEYNDLFVLGGASIYQQFLPFAKALFLTEFREIYKADTFFPKFDKSKYTRTQINKKVKQHGYVSEEITDFDICLYEPK